MPALPRIHHAKVVWQRFGCWPSFHDAEIVRVTLEANPGYFPSATFVLKTWAPATPAGPAGLCWLTLRFANITTLELEGFGHQNVIFSMDFAHTADALECTMDASVGLDAYLVAESATVVSLTDRADSE
ncbi:hypothetical protein GCM10027048_22540 [Hymenobacter coalescens]